MKTVRDLTLLPGIPGHQHSLGTDGRLSCGCQWSTLRYTVADIISRMNWLGQQEPHVRRSLSEECARDGHIPTGERIMVNPPIDTCYRCGFEYRDTTGDA